MPQPADFLFKNARVFTLNPLQPWAQAVVVRGPTIVYVGDNATAAGWQGPATQVIDAHGATLLPGFIDSHYHLLMGSLELDAMQLGGISTLPALADAVQVYTQENPQHSWLVGFGLPYSLPLSRHVLDTLVADRPLLLFAYDTHTAWANTRALQLGRLLEPGPTVGPNSEIVRGEDGLASGELREPGAYQPLVDLLPIPDHAEKRRLLHKGLAQAAQYGLTSVHNMDGDAEQLAFYAGLEDLGELTLRVYCSYSITPATPVSALDEATALKQEYQSDKVRAGGVKFFMDGVVESYTAFLLAEYAGRPGDYGGALYSLDHFTTMAAAADRHGLQIFVHVVGDAAVRRTLDGLAAVQQRNGRRDSRHRLEHIELIDPADVPRLADLGVIASMQPEHAPTTTQTADPWPQRVGPARWGQSFAWETIRRAGAKLVFGSDWPVVGQNPLAGLHAAVNRRPWVAKLPDQRQILGEAIAAYTCDAAYAEFMEDRKGQLRAGYLADLVLLDHDIFATPTLALEKLAVVLTMCDGQIVYNAS